MNALRRVGDPSATPWYAVLLMFGFLLNAYSNAPVHPLAVLRTLILGLLFAALLTAVLGALLRNLAAGGFVAALLIGSLVGWGRITSTLGGLSRRSLLVESVVALVALAALAVVLWLLWRLLRRPDGWRRLTYGFNVVGVLFVAVGILGAARSGALSAAANDLLDRPVATGQAAAGAPDIYFVMLDEYARPDVLQKVYGIDTGPYLAALQQRGFEVSDGNSSNYIATPLNMMAMFHMQHVPDIPSMKDVLAGKVDFQAGVNWAVNHNESFDLLRQHGYQIVEVAPPWEDVSLRAADVYVDNGGINEFETSLVERSALDALVRNLAPDFLFQQERDRITFAFEQIGKISAQKADRPRFVFVHIPAPHLPVVFGPSGEPTSMPYGQFFWIESAVQRGLTQQQFIDAYRGQLTYLDKQTIPALDQLIAHDPNAVVVLFGDEGGGVGMDWNDVPNSNLTERFANFFSARTPGKSGVFNQTKTLVNVMQPLFNTYFGLQLPLQPDLRYVWHDGDERDLYLWDGTPGPGG